MSMMCVKTSHGKGGVLKALRAALLILGLSSVGVCFVNTSSQAQEQLVRFNRGRALSEINVAQGQFITARTPADVGRVVVGDPEVATAVPLTGESFYILGKAAGRTTVAVYGTDDALLGTVNVEVGADTPDLATSIQEAVPQANVRVESINGRVRLTGSVPDSIALRKVLEVAQQYGSDNVINALRVTGGQQVMLEVRIVEANRNAGRELGISWFASGKRFQAATGAVLPPDTTRTGVTFNPLLPSGSSPFGTVLAQVLNGGVKADILIQALEGKGLGRRLAEPNLVALSGEKASFLAGGEVPIPIPGNDNTITVTYKEYGVRLNFTPVVLENGLINLKLEPEVSQIDPATTVRISGVSIPAFITRRSSTTLEVRDGQSFVMAGLLQSVSTRDQDQIPWLGQLPILGALFRSSSFQEQETDLVIIVTPHLVKPAKPGQPLRTPLDGTTPSNDLDFFLLGQLEIDGETQRRLAQGTGVIGPFGHIVEVPRSKRYVPKNATKKIIKP